MSKFLLNTLAHFSILLLCSPILKAENLLFDYDHNAQINISKNDIAAKRKYAIKFNANSLNNNLKFKLPNGKVVRVHLENRKKRKLKAKFETVTHFGRLRGRSKQPTEFQISLTTDDTGNQLINGRFRTLDGELYHISQDNIDSQSLILIDENKQLECAGEPHIDSPESENSFVSEEVSIRADTTISLLIAYTPDAISAAGSLAILEGRIAQMIADANTAHANSHTGLTYSLAALHALSANSTNDFGVDLAAAANTDGKWDELQSLRVQYCADQVVVIVGGIDNPFCGIGYLVTDHANSFKKNYMYSIVSSNLVNCPYTLAHELAHNLGSAHDIANAGSAQPAYNYSYGHKFIGNTGDEYRTVLAYAPGIRVPYFSNPNISLDSANTGTASANNATSLSFTTQIVSNYFGANGECSGLTPLPINTPVSTPIKKPGTGTPPITLPATEPDTIILSAKTKNKQTTFKVNVTGAGQSLDSIPVTLYYDKTGLNGFIQPYANLTTNRKGTKKIVRKRKKGYFMACYSTLCSVEQKS